MIRRLCLPMLTSGAVVFLAGCCWTPRREVAYVGPPPAPCDRCAAVPQRVAPVPAGVAVPAPPPGALIVPPATSAVPAVPAPGQGVVRGSYASPVTAAAPPAPQEPIVRLAPPELSTPGPGSQSSEPPLAKQPPPAVTEQREPSAAAPIDVPQFAMARPKVANGLQPFPDGVAWLKDHGYRTVLHVRAPGTDDTAARRQFEKYGIRFLTMDAEPRTLTKDDVDNFNRLVNDEANLPLFVYDKDGSVTGGLWYLYYRLMDGSTDEKARADAGKLGFRQERDDRHRTMWIAVQKLLEENGR
jgi:protein tyrosine phosphatase (PTP) superfamily phosphohydrolase (DUF442 family)